MKCFSLPWLSISCSPLSKPICKFNNLADRCDNKYKAQIRILVKAVGIEPFKRAVGAEFEQIQNQSDPGTDALDSAEQQRIERYEVYEALSEIDLATAHAGLISDISACPRMDHCALATARSIPVAQVIVSRICAPSLAGVIGSLQIKISGLN